MRKLTKELFFDKVETLPWSGCWIRDGAERNGYVLAAKRSSHIVAYTLWIGPVPKGMIVHHKCYIKACCNPDHLELMTLKEHLKYHFSITGNQNTNKTHCIRGHEFTEENTYMHHGKRYCRQCIKESGKTEERKKYMRRYYQENKYKWGY